MRLISSSFSARLTFAVMRVTMFFFLAVMGMLTHYTLSYTRQESIRNITSTLDATVQEVNGALVQVETAASNMVWAAQNLGKDETYLYDITSQMVRSNPNVVGSTVAYEPYVFKERYYFAPYSFAEVGSLDVSTKQLGSEKNDYFSSEWYVKPKVEGKAVWSEPYFDEYGAGINMSTYSIPMYDSSGKMYAVFTADISLSWLTDILQKLKPFERSTCILVSTGGSIVCQSTDWQSKYETIDQLVADNKELENLPESVDGKSSGYVRSGRLKDGRYVVYDKIVNGWSVVLVCPYLDVFADVITTANYLLLISLLFFILLFFVCRRGIRMMTRPLTDFSKGAMSIASGNFNTVLPSVKTRDEFYDLGKSLDYMQRSLYTYMADLKSTTAAKERIESELNIARDIQMNMVPHDFPKMEDGLDIYALLKPAKEVGGDLYDVIYHDGKLAFVVGDVSGKGVPASLIMANTKTALSILAGRDVADCIGRTNDQLCVRNDDNMFVTMAYLMLDIGDRKLQICNCGHNPTVIVNPRGKASFVKAKPNLPLGVMPMFPYSTDMVVLERGSRIIVYTDGVTEAENSSLQQYGEERLLRWAESVGLDVPAMDCCAKLYEDVKLFTGDYPQNDDITIMVLNC